MKNIVILSVLSLLFLSATQLQAQDYFKERRYDGIDFTKEIAKKRYVTISRRKYELVDKEEESFLGQKISYDKKQQLFFIKRRKKAMTFRETINYMKYVGNEKSAKELKGSLNLYKVVGGTRIVGTLSGVIGIYMLTTIGDEDDLTTEGLILLGSGAALYGSSFLFDLQAQKKVKKTLRYHNKNVRKFAQPVIAKNVFIPSGLGFKSVRTNLLNPTPIPTLSLSWSF